MNLLLELLSLAAFVGILALFGRGIRRLGGERLQTPVLLLLAMGPLSLLGFGLCALGFQPLPGAAAVEALRPHPWLTPAYFGMGLLGWAFAWRSARAHLSRGAAWLAGASAVERGALALLAAAFAAAFAWTLLPAFRTDELLYHLALPMQYLLRGRFVVTRGDIYPGFPAFTEMLFLWPLASGSESAARAVQLVVLSLGIWAVLALLGRRWRPAVLLGSLLFLLIPVVFVEVTSSYVDVVQVVFEVVAVLQLAALADEPADRASLSPLWAAAWLGGSAAACKYLGFAVLPFLLAQAVLLLASRRRAGAKLPGLGRLLLCAVPAAVLVLPWLCKNAVELHNPLFPFLNGVFKSPALSAERQETLNAFLASYGPKDEVGRPLSGLAALARLPVDLLFRARFDSTDFDGVLGLWPLAGLSALLVHTLQGGARRGLELPRALLALAGVQGLVFLVGSWQARFLLGPCFVLCIALAQLLLELKGGVARSALGLATASCVALQLGAIRAELPSLDARMLASGSLRHQLRLERDPGSALCDRANQEAARRVMLVWTHRLSYFCLAEQVADGVDEGAELSELLAGGPEEALSGLRAAGITHLLVDEEYWFLVPPGVSAGERAGLERLFRAYERLKSSKLTLIENQGRRVLFRVPAS